MATNIEQPDPPAVIKPTTIAPAVTSQVDAFSETIDLPRGKELSESSALALSRARSVRWIVIAGPVGSGKTTLLTCLYELFQWNSIPEYLFGGSETMPAFEERCYLSRTASENEEPKTPRTIYDPVPTYLHLKVGLSGAPHEHTDFLFTDVSGEMFEYARDSTEACKELTFLRRARHFIILLDSKRSLLLDRRWAMAQEAKTLLQSCLDSKMLAGDCAVRVLWSRFDYFIQAGDTAEHKSFREDVEADFRTAFAHRVADLKFSTSAARPTKAPKIAFGNGVVDLLTEWITHHPGPKSMNLLPTLSGTRESELFAIRYPSLEEAP